MIPSGNKQIQQRSIQLADIIIVYKFEVVVNDLGRTQPASREHRIVALAFPKPKTEASKRKAAPEPNSVPGSRQDGSPFRRAAR
ncbi:hypothetical protein X772_02380 [Mesorhizobium sp. LSJC280B00]|nr:hypothetical protein X772_02380 [Mesorhizobium sp. LSJC280B00]